jgi:hypothetical protein
MDDREREVWIEEEDRCSDDVIEGKKEGRGGREGTEQLNALNQ